MRYLLLLCLGVIACGGATRTEAPDVPGPGWTLERHPLPGGAGLFGALNRLYVNRDNDVLIVDASTGRTSHTHEGVGKALATSHMGRLLFCFDGHTLTWIHVRSDWRTQRIELPVDPSKTWYVSRLRERSAADGPVYVELTSPSSQLRPTFAVDLEHARVQTLKPSSLDPPHTAHIDLSVPAGYQLPTVAHEPMSSLDRNWWRHLAVAPADQQRPEEVVILRPNALPMRTGVSVPTREAFFARDSTTRAFTVAQCEEKRCRRWIVSEDGTEGPFATSRDEQHDSAFAVMGKRVYWVRGRHRSRTLEARTRDSGQLLWSFPLD